MQDSRHFLYTSKSFFSECTLSFTTDLNVAMLIAFLFYFKIVHVYYNIFDENDGEKKFVHAYMYLDSLTITNVYTLRLLKWIKSLLKPALGKTLHTSHPWLQLDCLNQHTTDGKRLELSWHWELL